jgi:hypothetical protein
MAMQDCFPMPYPAVFQRAYGRRRIARWCINRTRASIARAACETCACAIVLVRFQTEFLLALESVECLK